MKESKARISELEAIGVNDISNADDTIIKYAIYVFEGVQYLMCKKEILKLAAKKLKKKPEEMKNELAEKLAEKLSIQQETIRGYLKPSVDILPCKTIEALHDVLNIPYSELGYPLSNNPNSLSEVTLNYYLKELCSHDKECKGCCDLMTQVVSNCKYLKQELTIE